MHPVRISGALHTLNELARGRARIVIGGGGEALAALGLKPVRRVRAVRETVEIVRRASTGERFDYRGEIYQALGYGLGWLTAPPPAVYVGANMPQMLRMAGSVADGIMFSDLPPQLAAAALETARASADAAGRDGRQLWSSAFTAWHVYPDVEAARAEARRWMLLRGLFRPWVLESFLDTDEIAIVMANAAAFQHAFVSGSGVIDGVPERVVDKLIDNLTLTATPAALEPVRDELHAFRSAGLAALSLRLYVNPIESMELIARELLPALTTDP
jgi:alkanesulfonate monooxygenase SsuD/methylene tetrahydromethanopterin reductase-like flavin-dependent oxidoreductase (luciferase family)